MKMNDGKWLTSTSALEMLNYLCEHRGAARRKNGRRKLRLFACACCRRVWDKLTEERDRQIVFLSENFADELASPEELDSARQLCLDRTGWIPPAIRAAIDTTDPQPRMAASRTMFGVCSAVASHGVGYPDRWKAEDAAQAELLREIFGNPFDPIKVERRWLTSNEGAVVRVAQSIYQERNFREMPILADALEEAGCTDFILLGHCRGPGPHYRGCWALDALLGKE